MKTQPLNPTGPQEDFELRLRAVRTLWLAMFATIFIYYALTFIIEPREGAASNDRLSLMLLIVGILAMLISFPVKSRLITYAVEQERTQLVQQAYIVALALAEVPALLGMLDYFATVHRHYYVLFIVAAIGQLLHFPRREHIANASSRTKIV